MLLLLLQETHLFSTAHTRACAIANACAPATAAACPREAAPTAFSAKYCLSTRACARICTPYLSSSASNQRRKHLHSVHQLDAPHRERYPSQVIKLRAACCVADGGAWHEDHGPELQSPCTTLQTAAGEPDQASNNASAQRSLRSACEYWVAGQQ